MRLDTCFQDLKPDMIVIKVQQLRISCTHEHASVSSRFNQVRNNKPHLAKYRWQNIGWYFYEAMATGWLLGAKPINRKFASFRVRPSPTSNHCS